METSLPFVTVIVPVYNGAATIVTCVESLFSQRYPAECYEIIVVDNGSKDDTWKLLEPFCSRKGFKLISETKVLNSYGARNAGLAVAQGEIFAFTDSDCVPTPDWLQHLIEGYEDTHVGTFLGEILPLEPKTVIERYRGVNFWSQKKDEGKALPGCRTANCAFRRLMLNEIGVFDSSTTSAADFELFVRGYRHGWKHVVNYSAVVYHRNFSTVRELWRQSMRYGGGHRWRSSLGIKEMSYPAKPMTLGYVLRRDAVHFAAFFYRGGLHLLGRTHDKADPLLYVMTPLLKIVEETATYIGYRKGPVTR